MTTITCARPDCGVVKAVRKATQRYCSHRCHEMERDPIARLDAARDGGRASGRVRWHRSMAKWRARYPQLPAALARQIYLDGYNAGHTARRVERRAA